MTLENTTSLLCRTQLRWGSTTYQQDNVSDTSQRVTCTPWTGGWDPPVLLGLQLPIPSNPSICLFLGLSSSCWCCCCFVGFPPPPASPRTPTYQQPSSHRGASQCFLDTPACTSNPPRPFRRSPGRRGGRGAARAGPPPGGPTAPGPARRTPLHGEGGGRRTWPRGAPAIGIRCPSRGHNGTPQTGKQMQSAPRQLGLLKDD